MLSFVPHVQRAIHDNFSLVMLKSIIILLLLFFLVLALSTNNKWILAGEAAYLALP